MMNQELERAMQFILKQHAQLVGKVDSLVGKVDALVDVQQRAEERWERTETSVRALLAVSELQAGKIKDLSAAV